MIFVGKIHPTVVNSFEYVGAGRESRAIFFPLLVFAKVFLNKIEQRGTERKKMNCITQFILFLLVQAFNVKHGGTLLGRDIGADGLQSLYAAKAVTQLDPEGLQLSGFGGMLRGLFRAKPRAKTVIALF